QAANNRDRGAQRGTESRRFDLETSQSSPGCAWDICLCGRRGLHRKLPGQLFWSARDCEPFRQNRSRVCFVLLGWRHGWTISWRGTARRFRPGSLLALCAALAVTLVTASMLLGGHTAMWTILAVG